MKTSEKITATAAAIEATLKSASYGSADAHATMRIRFLANQLSGVDSYAAEKAVQIADRAAIAFSERKHFKHCGGLDALRAEMEFDLLNRIRHQAEKRRASGD